MRQYPAISAEPYRVMLPAVSGRSLRGLRGLGTSPSTSSEIQQGASIAVTAATGELAAVLAGTSTIIPLIGPALAGIALAVEAILNSGCGQTCIVTSQWANQAEPLLLQNIQAYFALPAPRAQSAQAYAISVFNNIWNGLVQRCSQQGLGTAGQNCISDRQAGACKWRQSATSPLLAYVKYGEPDVGECWDWFSGYLYPIQDDPDVVADQQATPAPAVANTGGSILPAGSSSTILLIGAAAVAVYALGGFD